MKEADGIYKGRGVSCEATWLKGVLTMELLHGVPRRLLWLSIYEDQTLLIGPR